MATSSTPDKLSTPGEIPSSGAVGGAAVRQAEVYQIPGQMTLEGVGQEVALGSTVSIEVYKDPESPTPLTTYTAEVVEKSTDPTNKVAISLDSAIGRVIIGRTQSDERIKLSNGRYVKILQVS